MSAVLGPEEAWTHLPVPEPLIAWVASQKWTGVPASITDLDVVEYRVVALRVAPWGGGGWLVESSPDLVEPLSELVEIDDGTGVLIAVLPVGQRPELGRELPRVLDILARRARERPGVTAA